MRAKGARLVAVVEGLDVLRKGGTVERVTEHLNPQGRAERGSAEIHRARAHPVVLPALHHIPAHRRRNCQV
ncbi:MULTISPECIES: hypothetical protein [unclassified Streptomyces]|uniref:hypothetical protein n=1 Tax=unclassified Streptomyces TaxID=2593676 RepID=UPI002DD9D6EC|nr:hypothetical protein [Streptomyces sp. NBC_00243]WRZ18052.1 hypothetical protein OHT59_05915 [Streptomyces sp. NBC_00243]